MILLVEVADLNLYRYNNEPVYSEHLLGEQTEDSHQFMVFRIPALFEPDIELFRAGKYSQFSDMVKFTIRAYSGLKYNWKDDKGNLITDAILMALEKHPALKQKWEEELGLPAHILTDDCELLNPPHSSFMDFQNPFPIPPEPDPAAGDEIRNAGIREALEKATIRRLTNLNGFSNNSISFDTNPDRGK